MPGIEYWARGARAANSNSIPQAASTPIQAATKSASQLNLSAQPPGQLQRIPQPVVNNSVPQFAEPPAPRGKVNLGPAPKLAVQPPINSYWTPRSQALMDLPIRGAVNLRPPTPFGFPPAVAAILPKAAPFIGAIPGAVGEVINPATSSPAGDPSGFGFPAGTAGGASVSAPAAGNPFGMPQNAGSSIGAPSGAYANGPGWYVRSRFQSQVDENGAVGPTEEVIGFIATFGSVASVTMGAMISDGAPWVNPNAQEILTTSGLGVTEVWGRSGLSFYHRLLSAVVEQIGAQPTPFPPSRPGDTPYWSADDTPDPLPFDNPALPGPKPAQVPSGGTTNNPVPTPTPTPQPQPLPRVLPGGGLPRFLPDPTPLPPLLPRTNPNPNPSGKSQDPALPTPLPLFMPSTKAAPPLSRPLLNPSTGTVTDLTPKIDRPPTPQPNISCSDPCIVNLSAGQQAQTAQQAATNSKLDQLTAVLTGAGNVADLGILGKLNGIDSKLGPQIPGGLSGKLGKLGELASKTYNFLQVDRILAILTYTTAVHNAFQLSNSLKDTLFSAVGNTLAVFQIGTVDENGNTTPYDVNEQVNKWTESFVKQAIGAENYVAMTTQWKKWSRIYQAGANIISSFQSIYYSIFSALEVIGSYNAKIGNALLRWSVVGERAYPRMNENPHFGQGITAKLEVIETAVSGVDQISSEVLSAQETVTAITTQKDDLNKAIAEVNNTKQRVAPPEAAKQKAADEAAKAASQPTI